MPLRFKYKVKAKPKKLSELKAARRAKEVWNKFGEPLGLNVAGWTLFATAIFVDKEGVWVSVELKILKNMRKHVTGKDFEFPKDYFLEG